MSAHSENDIRYLWDVTADCPDHIRKKQEARTASLVPHVFAGWNPDGSPIPYPIKISIAELKAKNKNATMADVAVLTGLFPSLTQAKKNGWNKPLTQGIHSRGKNKEPVELT